MSQPALAEQAVQTHIPSLTDDQRVLVIGGGPVAIRFAEELLKRRPKQHISVFGNEPYQPYNRVQLSNLLAGEIEYDEILTKLPTESSHPNFQYLVKTIKSIDTDTQSVVDNEGQTHQYNKLVIATGSRPHVPDIPGVDQAGVYTFRNLKDAEYLYARRIRSRQIVVLGGGLLGLEAARGLATHNTKVTVVQQGNRLMNKQLDDKAAAMLQKEVEALGIEVIVDQGVRQIHGRENRVSGVTLRDGTEINCDTVLVCAGIKANLSLARNAHIKVGRGISVDDQMFTSAENVMAIGECCEHRGLIYGLVNPGFEQAAIAADVLSGGSSHYIGSLEVSRLKAVGVQVASMGAIEQTSHNPLVRELKYTNKKQNLYRKISLYKGKVIGAVSFGEWEETRRVQEAYQVGRRIWPWQQLRFLLSGEIWGKASAENPIQWPATAVICQCNNITKGSLLETINAGCSTAAELSKETGAGTVCGSCKPLLGKLVGDSGPLEKETAWIPTLVFSLVSLLLVAALLFSPAIQVSDSVQTKPFFEGIWNDKFWKQVTGFTLLGLSVVGLLMSMRKRIKLPKISMEKFGKYGYWRLFHTVLGVSCVALLFAHTGLHLGENLNHLLMLNFLAVISIGALAGGAVSLAHTISPSLSTNVKKFFTWSHILITWPLPVLLGIHILTVYYF